METPKGFGQKDINRIAKSVRYTENQVPLSVGGNTNSKRWQSQNNWFWAKLLFSTAISGAYNRWKYDWNEWTRVNPTTNAVGWLEVPAGKSSTTGAGTKAYNSLEAFNTSSGVQGNGATLSGTQTLAPIGICIVQMFFETDDTGAIAYSFSIPNQVIC